MKPRVWMVFIAALLLMAATAVVLVQGRARQHLGPPGVKLVPEPTYGEDGRVAMNETVYLPPAVLGGSSTSVPISKLELFWLPPDTTYGRRMYEWPERPNIFVNVVLMGSDRTSIHKPEFCLNGQGWEYKASDTEVLHVPMRAPVPYELPVMKVVATKRISTPQGEIPMRGVYLYWFVSDREISVWHTRRVRSQTLHFLRTGELQRWAYISLFTPCYPGEEAAVVEWMRAWIQAAVPQFQVPPAGAPPARLAER